MVAHRGYGDYDAAPLRHRRGNRHHWLRTARLNAVGWTVLLGLCVVAAAGGVVVAQAIAVPKGWGASAAVLPLAAVMVLDRRRWAAMETSWGWGGSEAEAAHIATELADHGVSAQVDTDPPAEGWPEPGSGRGGSEGPDVGVSALSTGSLRYRNRDAKAVAAMLTAHGIHVPELP